MKAQPGQINLFTQEIVKSKKAKAQSEFVQTQMFADKEVAQFGVNANPLMPLSPSCALWIINEPEPEVNQSVMF